ncbi:hypothetical protein RAS14_27355, partial [Achromobacter aegrifaciens]|uniref:hypothetical protein n=2 Tax=Achromobacter aegrifaciens TaxID=1287736 RepID=UPI0027903A20
MSSRPRKASPEQTALLTAAFPARLQAEVAHIAEEICPSAMSGRGLSVIVQDESLTLPYRVQHGSSDSLFSKLDEPQALIYACIQSRHHDGHVRQRQIERLAGASEPWVVPFVVQLCSEYVVEILQDIEARLPLLDKRAYGTVLRGNLNRPGFRGGCLVKVKQPHRRMCRVGCSSLPQPRPAGY